MGLVLGKEDVEDDASQNRPESPTFSEPDEPAPPPPPEKKAARPTMVGGTSLFNLFAQKEEPAAPPPAPKPAPPKADRPTMVGGQSLFNLFSREEPDDSAAPAPAEPRTGILEKVGSATGSLLNLLGGMGSDPGEDAEVEAATKMQAKVRGSLERKKSAEAKKEPPKAGGQCCVIA